ncbi:hypothetical protein [Clostridium sp.]|uniref:hypothetical protein n=1 Tax=Clostridium sp. TaxID=1506 RepID=UPI001A505259|nr:hypothetical protein [Clostridium sp.]MBK5235280.1 hypothetical protein [Clostridium sp.]
MRKSHKLISIIVLMCFLISTISYAKDRADKTGEIINVAPYTGLSATVVHPKKLDLVLMTDYTGTKKSTLINEINNKVSNLYSKNVDAQVYVEDINNNLYTGETYFRQEYAGTPTESSGSIVPYSGGKANIKNIDINNSLGMYKRQLYTGYGVFTWKNDNSVTFKWTSFSATYQIGEAPTETREEFILPDAPTNIKNIGTSKHALYILTTDNKLYMSGDPCNMADDWWNSYMSDNPDKYTGMNLLYSDVKEFKSNYNGLAVLKTNGDVYYRGNIGLEKDNDDYSSIYGKSMNVDTKHDNERVYTYTTNRFLVTDGSQKILGMNNITRIQLGNESIIGLNDNTGECFGVGYNQGQFGWGDPYFRECTVDSWSEEMILPTVLDAKKIPLLDARKIKELYMYGLYTKVIQKDNTIWRLTGGGVTSIAPENGLSTSFFRELYSSDAGTYTQTGILKSDELFEIDNSASYGCTTVRTDNPTYSPYLGYNVNCFLTKYTYSINVTGSTIVKKDGSTISRSLDATTNVTKTTSGFFNGIKQIYSLNTDEVIDKTYREGSDKILLYISDNTNVNFLSKDLGSYYPMTGLNYSFMSFIGKNNFGVYIVTPSSILDFIEDTCTKQEVSLRQISNSSNDKHLYDKGNYTQALNEIEARYSDNEEPLNEYVIVDEDILKYNTQFTDKENDTKKDERWLYNHNPNVFLNPIGTISTNNQWVSTPITQFNKTGEYKTTYQVQDKPSLNPQFDNYNKWSNQTEQLEIIAHRRPIAKFSAKIPKKLINEVNLTEDFDNKHEIVTSYNSEYCDIQNNGYLDTKALNGLARSDEDEECLATVTINVPEDSVNAIFNYTVKGDHYTVELDGIRTLSYSYNMESAISVPLSPGTHTLKVHAIYRPIYRHREDGKWEYDPAIYGTFILDNLQLTYYTNTWINGSASDYSPTGQTNITYSNKSYDIDHTNSNENLRELSSFPDKGLTQEEWKWLDATNSVGGTWQLGKLSTYTKDHIYQISLRVKDIEGAWSNPSIFTLGDNMPEIVEPNNAPIAKFIFNTNVMTVGTTNTITDLSFDPDGDPIAHWDWRLYDQNGFLINDYAEDKPNLSILAVGDYYIVLKVEDNPSTPPALWSELCFVEFSVIDYTLTGQVNHTSKWNINRIKYNRAKTGTDDSPRTYDVFFPGENFELLAFTTPGANAQSVSVSIEGTTFSTNLVQTASATWTGDLWDESMINWPNKTVKFIFIATYPYGLTKTSDVYIKIDGGGGYWLQHREF